MSYSLDVIKVKGAWAMRMTVEGVSRYRLYHYKKEALTSMYEWENLPVCALDREFMHNFDSAQESGINV